MQHVSRMGKVMLVPALLLALDLTMVGFRAGSSRAAALNHRPTPSPTPSPTPPPPSSGTWTMTGSMNQDRDTYTLTVLQNGQVLAAGADDDQYPRASDTAELYNPATATWTYTNGLMKVARTGHTATLLPNGQVLVAGGCGPVGNNSCVYMASAELYNPTTSSWTPTGSISVARTEHTATLLPNGQVLVAGGGACADSSCSTGVDTPSAELYTPATGTWTQTGSMNVGRTLSTATLLPSGQVLVAGGEDNFNFTPTAELYNPATGSWMYTGSMHNMRTLYSAVLLQNGKVRVAGGILCSFSGDIGCKLAELYMPLCPRASGPCTSALSRSLPAGELDSGVLWSRLSGAQAFSAPQVPRPALIAWQHAHPWPLRVPG